MNSYRVEPFNPAQNINLVVGQLYVITFEYAVSFLGYYRQLACVGIAFGGVGDIGTKYGYANIQRGYIRDYAVHAVAQPGWTILTVFGDYGCKGNKFCSKDINDLICIAVNNFEIQRAVYNNTTLDQSGDNPDDLR